MCGGPLASWSPAAGGQDRVPYALEHGGWAWCRGTGADTAWAGARAGPEVWGESMFWQINSLGPSAAVLP